MPIDQLPSSPSQLGKSALRGEPVDNYSLPRSWSGKFAGMSDTPGIARLVSVPTAARLAGVNEKTVRRWIAAGRLSGIAGRRGWLVDADAVLVEASLAGTAGGATDIERAEPDVSDDARREPDLVQDVPGIRELVELLRERDNVMREKDQTIFELAGRCGFYQSELQHLQGENALLKERIALLEAPKPDPVKSVPAQMANHPTTERSARDSGAQTVSEISEDQPEVGRRSGVSATPAANGQEGRSGGVLKRFWRWLTQPL